MVDVILRANCLYSKIRNVVVDIMEWFTNQVRRVRGERENNGASGGSTDFAASVGK